MPIYMDLHNVPGITARAVAEAHILDVKVEHHYCCKTMTYWLDEEKGSVFCLIEAPDKESVRAMHEKAHGLIPNEIIEVNASIVNSFLGRIKDPEAAIVHPETHVKIFSDPAFRILLLTKTTETRLLQNNLGRERAQELLLLYGSVVREQFRKYEGREVFLKDDGFVTSFVSATQAIECALAIQRALKISASAVGLQVAVHGGVPVTHSDTIFGEAIQFARFLGTIGGHSKILISSAVRSRLKEDNWSLVAGAENVRVLSVAEDAFLKQLIETLTANWRNPEFDIPDFCRVMSTSKPQLYRKCMAITGISPNNLLREYRLLQALELIDQENRNIAQTTFDCGFSSPSYFTKCFQKRFGLQPLAYQKMHTA